MAKYKPESRRKLEKRVKDLDHKAQDRTKHMSNVIKKDAKAIADVSKNIRSAGTIEAGKEIKQHLQQSAKGVKREFGHQKKNLEGIVEKEGKIKIELEQRSKDSKFDCKELTRASSSIKETADARNKINQGKQAAQKDVFILNSLRDNVKRLMQRTTRDIKDMGSKFTDKLHLTYLTMDKQYQIGKQFLREK